MPLSKSLKPKLVSLIYPTLLLGAIGIGVAIPRFVKIKEVECASQFGPCSPEIADKLASFRGLSLAETKRKTTDFLTSEPAIRNFSIRFKLPSTLLVATLGAKARFAIFGEGSFANLKEDGEVLSIGKQSTLPYVEISAHPPNVGEKVDEPTLFALNIIERLYSAHQVRSGKIKEDHLQVLLPTGYTVLFPLEGDTNKLLGSLSLIIYELNKGAEESRIKTGISTIDLRFVNPVLR